MTSHTLLIPRLYDVALRGFGILVGAPVLTRLTPAFRTGMADASKVLAS
jgi:hypothetical protein